VCPRRTVCCVQAVLQGVHQFIINWLLLLPWGVGSHPSAKVNITENVAKMIAQDQFFFHVYSPVVSKLVPAAIPNIPFHITFKQGEGELAQYLINYRFSSYDVVSLAACSLVGAWYLIQKHWIANNLFGLAFAVNAVELLHLNNVITGCILLCGLFFYDIFWVFGTDVMVTVAKSFEAPIKCEY
jgi:hypothetical protein